MSEENISIEELTELLSQAKRDFAVAKEKVSFLSELLKEKKKLDYKKTLVSYEERRYRRYFMREYLGMSFAAIGKQEGCSSAAVKNSYEKIARRVRNFEERQLREIRETSDNYGIRYEDIMRMSEMCESIKCQ